MVEFTPVIIVTGAGRGIGFAILQYLLGLPNPPNILATSRNIKSIEPLAAVHKNLEVASVDFGAPSSELKTVISESVINTAVTRWGRIDALLLNHGNLEPVAKIDVASLEDWEWNYRVNFLSNVELIKSALPELRKSNGRVVLVSSGASSIYFTGWGAYGSTKAALNHLNSTLALEEPTITTVSIAPGIVDTDMQASLRGVHGKVMSSGENTFFNSLKENNSMVKPEDVGAVLANLALQVEKSLSGKYLNWDDEILSSYRA
ncbi:hypothetical protein TWF225_005836 [Orbilia oligospora]|nr:hypothetical protein TWF225_005836 [Orbilia oligospora]KAF3271232.1 hypothetical protein TWF217_005638 [Orbilia oligospora]KAF3271783.1 hypothetical protein TWF128_000323 [Orbilia oligospora]KAF3293630.1 hypothetical protein TWF132_004592 [Orbilia oligospora]